MAADGGDDASSTAAEEKNKEERPDKKKYDTALMLLIAGGLFGLHHLYLKRTNQAIVYACTGGFFLVGLVYDMFQMETYVSDANFDEDFVDRLKATRQQVNSRGGASLLRCSAEVIFGLVVGFVFLYALPQDWHDPAKAAVSEYVLVRINALVVCPLAIAFGVWFVGGIGCQRLSLVPAACGALMTVPILIYLGAETGLFYTALSADLWANYRSRTARSLSSQFDDQETRYVKHFCVYFVFVTAFWVVCITAAVNNGTVSNGSGRIPLRDYLWRTVRSPELLSQVRNFFTALRKLDWWTAVSVFANGGNTISDAVILGDMLGLDPSSTSTEVNELCEQLMERRTEIQAISEQIGDSTTEKLLQACENMFSRAKPGQKPSGHKQANNKRRSEREAEQKMMKFEL